jgi:nucleotidyltransferase substrate binding protein (TIGR01987 family)
LEATFQQVHAGAKTLHKAVDLSGQRELAWNVLKDYLGEQGFVGPGGSRNATREAFRNGLGGDGEAWMGMLKARNLTLHTCNSDVAAGIGQDILTRFYPAFNDMEKRFARLLDREDCEV